MTRIVAILLISIASAMHLCGQEKAAQNNTVQVTHQVTGLFMKERVDDLKLAMEELPAIKLVSIDYANAEAIFEYDVKKTFAGAKPDQVVQRFDNLLRQATRSTFGIKPVCTTPMDKLKLIEIKVEGLDCKACSLAAYEAVYKLPGVERATASFRDGLVTALINPEITDRTKLEESLRKKNIPVK